MYRFLVFVWQPQCESEDARVRAFQEQLRSALGWRLAWQRSGVSAWVSGERPGIFDTYELPNDSGLICGTLFTRHGLEEGCASPPIGSRDLAAIDRGGIEVLIARYWGRYAAIRLLETGVQVLRDPSGMLPVLYTRQENVHIVFSDVASLVSTLGIHFTINWPFVTAYTACSSLTSRETGLVGVSELQPGECLRIATNTHSLRFAWHPLRALGVVPPHDLNAASGAASRTLKHCVASWSAVHERVMLRLSGGLDSSVIAACLAGAGRARDMPCLNYHGDGVQEEERDYARAVVTWIGAKLVEHVHQGGNLRLERISSLPPSPRPYPYSYYLEHVPLAERIASEHGATAVFDGAGGDALFFQGPTSLAVTDRWYADGPTRSLLSIAMDGATIEQTTLWQQLRKGIAQHFVRDALHEHRSRRRVVEPWVFEAFDRGERWQPPLLPELRGVSPGKRAHILSTQAVIPFYEPFASDDGPDVIHPVYSQPVMELFYAIDLATLIHGGRDRAVMRHAFQSELPSHVIQRRGKGASYYTAQAAVRANQNTISNRMLEGQLTSRMLLSRHRLKSAFDTREADSLAVLLMDWLPLEMWLNL